MIDENAGFGAIKGRRVLLTADDFTLRAGHADGALMAKTLYMEQLACFLKVPMIKLVDGSSGTVMHRSLAGEGLTSQGVVQLPLTRQTTVRTYLRSSFSLSWCVSASSWKWPDTHVKGSPTGSWNTELCSCSGSCCRPWCCESCSLPFQCYCRRYWCLVQCRPQDC